MQRHGSGTVPGCQNWRRKGRYECLDSEEHIEGVHAFHTYGILATETVAMEKTTYYSTGSVIPKMEARRWFMQEHLHSNGERTGDGEDGVRTEK
ncbi:hypothetical protein EYF80_054617 [Liparis tanakae]|uniref:Uncharacterized protein n=1 Tax=Liparis tanakae TaxID=230148 RepID=A0A4Z2F408_9TELE|nr:hypothetical protein EYF80_054617 [Liparis tanakae]